MRDAGRVGRAPPRRGERELDWRVPRYTSRGTTFRVPRPASRVPTPAPPMRIYEVFYQSLPGDPMTHCGSLQAPDDALALQYARDVFSRRNESLRLWVVARE